LTTDERFYQYVSLFSGNTSAYGTEQGGCVRQEATPARYMAHLNGEESIGIYPMVCIDNEWIVHWGCVDLDVKADHKRRWDYETREDAWTAACNLKRALHAMDLEAWVESTKSGGFHVWVFSRDWVYAADMRHCLLAACRLVDVPPTEVNPKNTHFDDPTALGNYVRLPYPAAFAGGVTRPMVDTDGNPIAWNDFVDHAWRSRSDQTTISEIAALYVPPPKPTIHHEATRTIVPSELGTVSRRLRAIIENGPLKQEDRSGWLYYVARLCADDGLTVCEAEEIVALCDERHTRKFVDRRDGAARIAATVEKAYS